MVKYFFLGVSIFNAYIHANSQIDIFLKEYGEYITSRKCKDSIVKYIKDSSFLEISLFTCKGEMYIQEFDRNGVLLTSGAYQASLDTLKEYVDVFTSTFNHLFINSRFRTDSTEHFLYLLNLENLHFSYY